MPRLIRYRGHVYARVEKLSPAELQVLRERLEALELELANKTEGGVDDQTVAEVQALREKIYGMMWFMRKEVLY